MNREAAKKIMNDLGARRLPFLFVIDFEENNIHVKEPAACLDSGILYDIEGQQNFAGQQRSIQHKIQFSKQPIIEDIYQKGFEIVRAGLRRGDSFLVNLTYPTAIQTNLSLDDIFYYSKARYKLLFKNHFTCFSPEIFVKIDNQGKISSFPMKGTIDAEMENAAGIILENPKEKAEHNTIVDLIRNDLSKIATGVRVERYRYIDELKTNGKTLLQVSSEISGQLGMDWNEQIGDAIFELLPAGSISGAPKKSTLEIIARAEAGSRGFYTGVFGFFDGKSLNSAVMIRFIEQDASGKMWFRSGGGVTVYSDFESEYRELCDKVYLPILKD